ncbi:Hypothetical predicted protein [Mytilus galloprovincialis]|uniref:VWFD domain-containing protein n=1 Tax=Mytilus galloprovincialis TaxID=29158 RepID=A0A8B6E3M7_MYTGA|nr:Hypothetical predicted protein [Mytilus galloprovincialis]
MYNIYTEGWYKFSGNENILTKPPKPRQCGSLTPIWFDGKYPTSYAEILTVKACVVGNDTDCEHSWNVSVMHCGEYNVAYYGSPEHYINTGCGRYCMEYTDDPCSNYSIIEYDFTRHEDFYYHSHMYVSHCDDFVSGGWNYFEGGYNLSTSPLSSGQCRSYSPIWINESKNSSKVSTTPSHVWDEPCHWHNIITSNFERSVSYTLQNGEYQDCYDLEIHIEAWYKFSGNESIPNHPPKQGQCSSYSPIWLNGLYPTTYGEVAYLTACVVGNDTDCENSWNVTVMHCDGYNVAKLKPTYKETNRCAKYCIEYTRDPCSNYSVIDYDFTRHQDYFNQSYMYMQNCDHFSGGWYYFEGGYSLLKIPPLYGQCSAYYPIWINETIEQTYETDLVYLRACEGHSWSDCAYTWSIPTMKCGTKNIMYLRQQGICGRFCLESRNSSDPSYVWDMPCHWHNIITSTFDRSINYTLQSGENEDCYDWEVHMKAWYRFSGNESILTKPPKQGQCGSSSPFWLDGLYPTTYGEIASLTACVVGNDTDCENSWNINVMHCDGYNVAELKPAQYDMNSCGKYCMEYTKDPCSNYSIIDYDFTRHKEYYDHSYNCDSFWSGGWYYFEDGYSLATSLALSGQCGSLYPIWINETIEQTYDTHVVYLRACQVGYKSDCAYTWSIPTMKCGTKNIMYLRQKGSCGRFCLESKDSSEVSTTPSDVWDEPCQLHNIITSYFERSVSYTLQKGEYEYEDCYDREIHIEAWYKFSGNESIPTYPPKQGQCGSYSPIWLNGLYPTIYGGMASLTACVVGNDTDCENSWNVTVIHCDGYNVAKLKPTYNEINRCAKYCMEYTSDPCSNFSVIDYDFTRHQDYFNQSYMYMHNCDYISSGGWYYFEGGYSLLRIPPLYGQCSSYYPIWINETIEQTYETDLVYLRACEGNDWSDCAYSWSIPTMKCGTKNVMYLRQRGICGRFCLESRNSSDPSYVWDMPCHWHNIITSTFDRSVNYTLQSGEYEDCYDWEIYMKAWYRFSGNESIPTHPPKQGQCGSSSPIWLDGLYPTTYGEVASLTACVVGNDTDCENSWNINVMHCDGYNVAELKHSQYDMNSCRKYCMEYTNDPCSNYSVIDYDFTRHQDYYDYSYMSNCDSFWSGGWYYFEYGYSLARRPALSGQCGSQYPIWINETIETIDDTHVVYLRACQVGYESDCAFTWSIPTMQCGTKNIMYLREKGRCGRFCLESKNSSDVSSTPSNVWDEPCQLNNIIANNFERSVNYTLQSGEYEDCYDREIHIEAWYKFSGNESIPTYPPKQGQCGSSSPIWLNGIYPTTYGVMASLTACMVGNDTECGNSWNVSVMHCDGYNVARLKPEYNMTNCGRYCTDSTVDPCSNYTSIKYDPTRHANYNGSMHISNECESSSLYRGWYRFDGNYSLATSPVLAGQCGTYNPIWINGSLPTDDKEIKYVRACEVEMYSECINSWTIPMMKCGDFDIMYLRPTGMCGRYCLEREEDIYSSMAPTTVHMSSSQYHVTLSDNLDTIETSSDLSSSLFESHKTNSLSSSENGEKLHMSKSSSSKETGISMGDLADSLTSDLKHWNTMETIVQSSSFWTFKSVDTVMSSEWMYQNEYDKTTILTSSYSTHDLYSTSDISNKLGTVSVSISSKINVDSTKTERGPSSFNENWNNMETTVQTLSSSFNLDQIDTTKLSKSEIFKSTSSDDNWNKLNYDHSKSSLIDSWSTMDTTVNPTSLAIAFNSLESSNEMSTNVHLYTTDSSTNNNANSLFDTKHVTAMSSDANFSPSKVSDHYLSTSQSDSTSLETEVSDIKTTQKLYWQEASSTDKSLVTSTENNYVDLNITDYIYWPYAYPTIPTYDLNSEDHQLMFQCYVYSRYYFYNSYDSVLNSMTYDIQWYIDNEEFLTKTDIAYDKIENEGRLKSTDWMHRERKMGINIKCGIRFHLSSNKAFMESWNYYAGLDMWPHHLSISSGESATVYVWTTVPIACRYNDTTYSCKVKLDLFDFNEQFTAGAPMYCNNSVTEMTKPSMCGLELDGWQQWAWQTLDVNLPENTAADQEYQAKIKLRVLEADDDPIWSNYQLPEVTVHVVNDNVTDDYWWWYGSCSSGTDPWFSTFDWQWYDFHDQGEFVLYRHKTKPIEVHTIQRRYESHHTWTENCAIAVRAASDVFIIYGCGRPTKWIIRRLNCGIGNEYLEVYSRWGGYEIVLPTGSRVYVWISLNRRINAFLTMSRTDRYQTEGLCGTWNRNYEDDYTGRDGVVYDNATTFARTWSVPANDSLFIEKKRTEKLSQSFMYCSCMNSTQDGLSPNVDCSWKETMPTCPPLNWGREPCSIRSKRSADDDDDVTIDVSPDIVAYIKEPVVDPGWKNGWNETAAEDACNSYFTDSILFDACSSLSNVNVSSAILNCFVNIKIAGTDEYMADSFELFKTQCINEVRTNNSLYSEMSANGTSIAQLITENDCPFECKYNGVKNGDCVEGFCNCYTGFTGEDCRVNMTAPPVVATEMSNDSLCDTGSRACNYISVFGENFYISNDTKCRNRKC